ncbi:MAG: hypothetical protein Ct9H90mP27_4330 [Gammaproteobacteria bacterium]|nr:MAG: hypothetical protein Ct9H90mP27_4330 [Gammaproteobacteria bacterium]
MPEALIVLVIVTTIGLAFVAVRVLARSSSTQLNIKQKKIVTPMRSIDRKENSEKKKKKTVPVDLCHFIKIFGDAGHESFRIQTPEGS